VSDKAQRTIRIKWVRSGIGFTYHQKRIVRSLGLKKLNQEVERPDTPQIRGLVAKVPHLVKIVEAASKAAWTAVPEYTIYAPEAVPSKLAETAPETPAAETEKAEAPATGDVTAAQAASAHEQPLVEAATAAEAAPETPGDLATTKIRESADYPREAVPSKLAETAPETAAEETEKAEAAATGEVTGAPAAGADEPPPAEAATAAEAATETPGDLAATELRMSADASAKESAKAGEDEEAGSEEGQP
jgi:large subunit ribosomal protein L30